MFTVEAIIKLIAFSKEYFSVGWNIFDLVIVAFSLPDLVFFVLDVQSIPGLEEVAKIIKICRLVCLLFHPCGYISSTLEEFVNIPSTQR